MPYAAAGERPSLRPAHLTLLRLARMRASQEAIRSLDTERSHSLKMSRRKQANPKPVKNDELGLCVPSTLSPVKQAQTDSHRAVTDETFSDEDDFDPPLVIDTEESTSNAESIDVPSSNGSWESSKAIVNKKPPMISAPISESRSSQLVSAPDQTNALDISRKSTRDVPKSLLPTRYSNSVGSLKDYLENTDMESKSPASSRNSISSETSSIDTTPVVAGMTNEFTSSQKGSAPNKTRRKGDRILPVNGGSGGEKFVCPVCKSMMTNLTEFTKHIRSHNNGKAVSPNTCTICGKVLSSQSSLDRHMLVHSGERPFNCSVCKMSFTTNGNMHRHMRIHEKELGTAAVNSFKEASPLQLKSRQQKRKSDESFPDEKVLPVVDSDSTKDIRMIPSLNLKRQFEGEAECRVEGPSPAKRVLSTGMTPRDSSYISPSNSSDPESYSVSPYSKLLGFGKTTQKVLEEPADTRLECPLCSKTYLSGYGLDMHLETHGSQASLLSRCQLCGLAFQTPRLLHEHKVKSHRQDNSKSRMSEEKNGFVLQNQNKIPVGFHDLEFMDFSSDKFEVVAKAWCEQRQRRSSSINHTFICDRCDHAFPSEGALKLHRAAHAPERPSTCVQCQVTYSTRAEYEDHARQHCKDVVVKRYANMTGTDDNLIQDTLTQEEFLLVIGLKVNRPKADQTMPITDPQMDEPQDLTSHFQPIQQGTTRRREKYSIMAQIKPVRPQPVRSSDIDKTSETQVIDSIRQDFADVSKILQITNTHEGIHPGKAESRFVLPPHIQGLPVDDDRDSAASDDGVRQDHTFAAKDQESPDRDEKEGPFTCRFCNEVIHSYRAFKGHEREHLGLSPYKCKQCNYSSADKSTLTRHLRTHNGERPFQCLLCDFAFTTKANCERHVRKKHGCTNKEEIESSISYSAILDKPTNENEFGSPDTVCKFCGEDFKFFRDLKHHLRSHSTCPYKPYMCTLCWNGFSTKANCMRHIQKQHTEIEQNQLEAHIQVNEMMLEAAEDGTIYDGNKEGDAEDCSLPKDALLSPNLRDSSLMEVLARGPQVVPQRTADKLSITLPVGRNAHDAIKAHLSSRNSQSASKISTIMNNRSVVSGLPVIAGSSSTTAVKEETDSDQPLDFSLKSQPKQENIDTVQDDQPMDLSTKTSSQKTPLTIPVVSRRLPLASGLLNPTSQVSLLKHHNMSILSNQRLASLSPANRNGAVNQSAKRPPSESAAMRLPVVVEQTDHRAKENSYSEKEYAEFYVKEEGKLQCPKCKMLFKHGLQLVEHMRIHTKERPFQCSYCSVSFSIKTNLDRHIKSHKPQNTEATKFTEAMDLDEMSRVSALPETNNNIPTLVSSETKPFIISASSKTSTTNYNSDSELASVSKILNATNATSFQSFLQTPSNDSFSASSRASPSLTSEGGARILPAIKSEQESSDGLSSSLMPSSRANLSIPTPVIEESASLDDSPVVKKKRNSYADSPHKLQCPYCTRAFPWTSSLMRHILTHTGQKPFKCPKCPVTFSTKSNRERHMIRKHGLDVHDPATRQMMDRPYKCHLCVFSSFATAANLVKHYTDKHPGKDIPDSVMTNASWSEQQPSTEEIMAAIASLEKKHQENQMAGSGVGGQRSLSDLTSDMANFDEDEDEEDYDESLIDGPSLSVSSPANSRSSSPASCRGPSPVSRPTPPLATEKVTNAVSSRGSTPVPRHVNNVTPTPQKQKNNATPSGTPERVHINPERDNYNVDKIVTCWKCDESYPDRKSLLRHLKEHNIDLPYKCYLCDASFDNRMESLQHKILKHPNDWETVKDKNRIRSAEEFVKKIDKVVDEIIRRSEGGGDVDVMLSEDFKADPDYGQRKVYCSLCPKRFWSLQDLRRHMRSHTGERPFECDICQARFTLKHSMMRHRRKHGDSGAASGTDDEGTHAADHEDDGQSSKVQTSFQPKHSSTGVSLNVPPVLSASPVVADSPVTNEPSENTVFARYRVTSASSLQTGGDGVTESGDNSADMLRDLLGVDDLEIDRMLTTSATEAAKRLGM